MRRPEAAAGLGVVNLVKVVGVAARGRRGGEDAAAGGAVAVEDGGGGEDTGLLEAVFDGSAGETGLAHDTAHTGVVEDGDDKLLKLDLDRYQGRLVAAAVLLLLDAAAALVGLGALEGRYQSVGERRLGMEERGRRGGEAIEGDVEAQLQCSALEWVGRLVVVVC